MILREAFCDWVSSIVVDETEPEYRFGDNCLFINFNYTDTLEKRFDVPHENIFHIHGEATQKDSIVFGHSKHPQLPVNALYDMGGWFRGLFFVERLLYHTDKHAYLHYIELLIYLARRGVRLADVKNIYVLGHSFGPADLEYFEELASVTGGKRRPKSCNGCFPANSMEALHLMLADVILTYGNDGPHPEFDADAARTFAQQVYQAQKDDAWKSVQKQYRHRDSDRPKYPNRLRSLEQVLTVSPDAEPAKWYITCRSEKSKSCVEKTMHDIGVKNYELYRTIDECIEAFKVE